MSTSNPSIKSIQDLFLGFPLLELEVNSGVVLRQNGILHKDKIYYVINRYDKNAGLFSYYFTTLSHIVYASLRGWTPIVDLRTGFYYLLHDNEAQNGKINAWDLFFNQPCDVGLEIIENASNVITANAIWGFKQPIDFATLNPGTPSFEIFRNASLQIPLNSHLQAFCNESAPLALFDLTKCIGISYRAGYDLVKPRDHFMQPTAEEMIELVKYQIKSGNFDSVFLATEDESALELFKSRLGEIKIHTVNRLRVGNSSTKIRELDVYTKLFSEGYLSGFKRNELIESITFGRENDRFLINCEYISEMYFLSKCGGFIGNRSNGNMYAILKNGGNYKFLHLPDRVYP